MQPFMEFDFNTSSMVRDALPELIEQTNKRKIKIFKYARVTRDTYEDVRRVSKEIWGGQRALFLPEPGPNDTEEKVDIDVILHLGMVALGWGPDQFRFETIARRDGYELPGDDGKYVDSRKLKELGLPETLATSFDIEAAWRKVKEKFPVSAMPVAAYAQRINRKHRMSRYSFRMMQGSTSVNSVSIRL